MVVTEQCLLSHTRNPHLDRAGIERELKVSPPLLPGPTFMSLNNPPNCYCCVASILYTESSNFEHDSRIYRRLWV